MLMRMMMIPVKRKVQGRPNRLSSAAVMTEKTAPPNPAPA